MKTALVTGAAQGNGRAISAGLAGAGYRVILTDIDATRLAATAAEIAATGATAHAHTLDVRDRAAAHALAATIAKSHGDISVLNNAGIIARGGILADSVLADWDRLREVNVDGLLNVTRAFAPQLIARRGAILNIASIRSFSASVETLAYGATKGAVKQITQSLALELAAHGVRVNALAPGVIETAMTEPTRDDPAALAAFLARIPMKRIGRPEELVGAALFLVSEAASYITGAILPVDGGYLAG